MTTTAMIRPALRAKCYESVYSEALAPLKPSQTVELRRFELLTSSMRTKRSTN